MISTARLFAFTYIGYASLLSLVRYFGPLPLAFDDGYFFLTSYSWLNGLGFVNFWVSPLPGSKIFNWHGFLQPILVAELSPCSTLQCVHIGLIALGGIYLAIWYVAVNTTTSIRSLRWALYVIGVSFVLKYSARPELLASLELICIVLLFYCQPNNNNFAMRAIVGGVIIALAVLTSPVAGAFAGLGVAAATVYLRRNDSRYVGLVAETGLGLVSALCGFALILFFVYPLSAIVWINGIIRHSFLLIRQPDDAHFFKVYFMSKAAPLLGLMFFPLAEIVGLAAKDMWQARDGLLFSVFALVSATFLYLLYFSAIRLPFAHYNFTALVPAVALTAVIYRNHIECEKPYTKVGLIAPVVGIAVACALSQFIWAAQSLAATINQARLPDEISASADQYLAKNRRIAMDSPLAGAISDVEKLKKIDLLFFVLGQGGKLSNDPPDVDILFRGQSEFGVSALAKEIPGFRLVVDKFDHSAVARFLTPPGSYYAIYCRCRADQTQCC